MNKHSLNTFVYCTTVPADILGNGGYALDLTSRLAEFSPDVPRMTWVGRQRLATRTALMTALSLLITGVVMVATVHAPPGHVEAAVNKVCLHTNINMAFLVDKRLQLILLP